MSHRQVVLDIETTGLDPREGHRIIEIGCVELEDRSFTKNDFGCYINPQRSIDRAALEVHGITNEFLADKPSFADVAGDMLRYLEGAELVIHNAGFDTGFINHELGLLQNRPRLEDICTILDTLAMAKQLHPGQRNSLDALCKRYRINVTRNQHGAMIDAGILAELYLAMSGGQISFFSGDLTPDMPSSPAAPPPVAREDLPPTPVVRATPEELQAHNAYLRMLQEQSGHGCPWLQHESGTAPETTEAPEAPEAVKAAKAAKTTGRRARA